MQKTTIILTFCAVNIPSLHTMQLTTHQKHSMKPILQQLRHCGSQGNSKSDIHTRMRTKANRLFAGNSAMCLANIAAACVTNNPYFLLPLVPHGISMIGINSVDLSVFNKLDEPALIRDLGFFVQQRKPIIETFLNDINQKNAQIQWLKNEISHELELKNMGAKAELLEAYLATLSNIEKAKSSSENEFIEYITPIFETHKSANLEECLRYNEKKIAALDRALIFKLPSMPLALLPKFMRTNLNSEAFDAQSSVMQAVVAFDVAWIGVGTVFAATIFPIHVACILANMAMADRNQLFFEQRELEDKKSFLKQLRTLIQQQQDHSNNKS